MEPQRPINKPIPPTSAQSQLGGKHLLVFVGLGVAVLLIIAGGVRWLLPNGNSTNPQIEQNKNTTQQEQETQFLGLVKYISITAPAIKIIPQVSYQATIRVLNIGTITDGQFKDKTLALALYEHGNTNSTSTYGNTNSTHRVQTYAYFISDKTGKPIAWDKNFFHDNSYCYNNKYCGEADIKKLLGLTNSLQQNLDFLPKEFSLAKYIYADDQKTLFSISDSLIVPDISPSLVSPIGQTETGLQIVRAKAGRASETVLSTISYYIVLPFGKMIQIFPEPDFVNTDDVPQLTWTVGTKSVASYRYGHYAYGWQDCYDGISADQLQSILVQSGTTIKGDAVYEVKAQKHSGVYKCLHEKTKRYVYNGTTQEGAYQDTVSYVDFISSHPMFFWKHPYGDLIAFVRSDVVPAAEKAKPVIYLYPEKSEKVSVKVSPLGGFLKTNPDYGNGWVLEATPDGVITNLKDGKQYPYLFWEGGKEGVVETPQQGFVVAKSDVSSVLENKLSQFGLNKQERDDFLEFWVPKLSRAPYYFITFISRSEINRVSPMSVYPQPDSIIRVLMDYKPLTQLISVESLNIISTERKGFTVVEWGGIIRD